MSNQASQVGIELNLAKEWITSATRARPLHERLDGQIVGLNEQFKVDHYHSLTPGGFGVASMDINCRCTIRSVFL